MPNVRIIETELVEWKVDRSFDYLIHAASPASPTKYKSPESIVQSNLGFLESLREQCLPPSVLFISSGEVYGSSPPLYVDESYNSAVIPRSARSVYPEAKISTERLLQEMKRDGLTSPLIVRLFHSFGPGLRVNDGRSFGDFLWSAAHAENLSLLSSGSSIRTFLYIEDAVAGLLTVLTKGIPGEPYNIGSDKPMAISEFADLVARIAGVEVLYPATSLETRDDYVHSPNLMVVPSLEKAVNLGWRPMVELGKGVERTLDWIRSVSR
jgi:nucleoside-diphosphate-sugar epimerase